jgi:hypothetical protein
MSTKESQLPNDLSGCRVIILTGVYGGHEGVCLGKSADGLRWAISPDSTNVVLQLLFGADFGILTTSQE